MYKITMPDSQNITVDYSFENAFDRFINYKKSCNISNETIRYYTEVYRNFTKFFNPERSCREINQDTIIDYELYLQNTGVKPVTIRTKVRGLRAILYYSMESGKIASFRVKLPKIVEEMKEPYSDEEMARLLKKPNSKTCKFVEYRTWVLINYLYGTAQRLGTVVEIKNKDIDLENKIVRIRHLKSGKTRIFPLGDYLCKILKEYMKIRGGSEEDYLFCTDTGKKMCKGTIQSNVRHYNASRGVKKTSVHLFRHTAAKQFIKNGGRELKLQSFLDHSTLEMSRRYVNFYGEELKEGYNDLNPLERFISKN